MNILYLGILFLVGLMGLGVGAGVGVDGFESAATFIVFSCMAALVMNFVFDRVYPAVMADAGGELPRQKRSLRVIVLDAETGEPVSEVSSYDFMPEDRRTFLKRKLARIQKREAKA